MAVGNGRNQTCEGSLKRVALSSIGYDMLDNQQQWLNWLIFDEGAKMDGPMKVHVQQRESGRPSDHIRGFGSDWF